MANDTFEIRSFNIKGSVEIAAAPDVVWQAVTTDIYRWWNAPFVCCDDTVSIELDMRIGGALYEKGADGTEVLWGVISGYTPGEFIEFTGCCGMAPPVHSSWHFMLEPTETGTRLSYSHRAMGYISEAQQENYDKGWQELLGNRLKSIAES